MIEQVFKVSSKAPKRHTYQVLSKLMEEVGELAQEVNIDQGFLNKPVGKDGIIGEALDVINCAIDIIYLNYPEISPETIEEMMQIKLNKWAKIVGL